jgi:hypothetical protein
MSSCFWKASFRLAEFAEKKSPETYWSAIHAETSFTKLLCVGMDTAAKFVGNMFAECVLIGFAKGFYSRNIYATIVHA